MDEITSLSGPVELVEGKLVLRIPTAEGGAQLAAAARGIGRIEDDELVVEILPWLATKLRIREGTIVAVDNRGGKFNITPEAE
ncbi:MAG: hypothetical protein ACJ79K_17435 [Gemmatimonadaceae bacterium]